MAKQIAFPTFVTGPADKLATVDVYKTQQQVGQVVNSIQSILTKYNPTLARSLVGFNSFDLQGIVKGALNGVSGITGNQTALLDRALQLNPNIASTIRSMDSSIREQLGTVMSSIGSGIGAAKGSLGAGLGQLGSGTFNIMGDNGFQCTIDELTSNISPDKIFQTTEIGNLVNSITGKSTMSFNDIGSQVGLFSSTIKQCFDCEVSGVTKDIFAIISDRQVLGMVAREVLPDIVKYSSIDDLYNLATNVSNGELLAAAPSLLNLFARSFGNDYKSSYYSYGKYNNYGNNNNNYYGYNSAAYISTYSDLIRAFDAAYPGWNTYIRMCDPTDDGDPGETVINISPLIGGTSKFNDILNAGALNASSLNEKVYLMAPLISSASVEEMISKQYPKTKFYFNAQVEKVKDPRTLNKL